MGSAEGRSSRSYDLLWLSLALLPLVGLAFMLPIPAQDYWWYLRLGRDILKDGAVPLVDTISYSRLGQPILYQAWLAALIFWKTYQLGGATLMLLLRGVLIGLTYGIVWWIARRESGPRVAALLVILLGLASSSNWVIRPQLFAYPLFAVSLLALYRWQGGENRLLWVLPFSALLWANLHGSFGLLYALAGAALVFGKGNRRLMLAVLASMLLASLVNPHGLRVWVYLITMFNSPSNYRFSTEWLVTSNLGWQMNIFFGWLLVFAPLAAFSPRKLSLLDWAWFLGFGWLALSGVRFVIWFHVLMAVQTAALLSDWARKGLDRPVETVHPARNIAIACLLLLMPLGFLPGLRAGLKIQESPIYELSTTPIAAVEWLSAHPELPGPVFNDYAFGSYLAYALPSRLTWIDTRMYNFPPGQWEEYTRLSAGFSGWQEVFDREGINLLLLSAAAQPELIRSVEASPLWCEEYRDPYAVIFIRCASMP